MHQMCLYSVQAYAHDVSSTPGRSNGGHIPVPTPPPSHPDSTASAPDTGDVASSLPSQYHSGGPETPPVNTMAQAATEAVTAAHPAALDENDTLQPVSYGAHTTMQPQLALHRCTQSYCSGFHFALRLLNPQMRLWPVSKNDLYAYHAVHWFAVMNTQAVTVRVCAVGCSQVLPQTPPPLSDRVRHFQGMQQTTPAVPLHRVH